MDGGVIMPTQVNGDTGVSQCQPLSVSQDDLQTGVVGKGPAFSARLIGTQSIPNSTDTKVLFSTEDYDTDNAYTPATGRFQPTVAGYYLITALVHIGVVTGNLNASIFKNGVLLLFGGQHSTPASGGGTNVTGLVFLNGTTDFVEIFVFQNNGAAANIGGVNGNTYFQGFLARSAT